MVFDSYVHYYYATQALSFLDDLEALELNTEQLFIIKNEIVNMLEENLPSIKQYEDFYLAFYTFLSVMGDKRYPVSIDKAASASARSSYYSNKLLIEVLRFIEPQLFQELSETIDAMMKSEDLDEAFLNAFVDFWLQFDRVTRQFLKENQSLVEEIKDSLNFQEARQQYFDILKSILIQRIIEVEAPDFEGLEKETIIAGIDKLFEQMDRIIELLEKQKEKGVNFYNRLVQTEGQLIKDYLKLAFTEDMEEYMALHQQILIELLHVDLILTLTEEEIDTYITLLFDIVVLALIEFEETPNQDIVFIQETLQPFVINTFQNIAFIRSHNINYILNNEEVVTFLVTSEEFTYEERYMIAFLWAINELIEEKDPDFDAYFSELEDILLHPFMLSLFNMPKEEMETQLSLEHELFEFVVEEIKVVAKYDMEQLTEDQSERLLSLIESITQTVTLSLPIIN